MSGTLSAGADHVARKGGEHSKIRPLTILPAMPSICPRCGKLRRYCLCGGKPAAIPADALTVAIRAEIAAARAKVRLMTARRG